MLISQDVTVGIFAFVVSLEDSRMRGSRVFEKRGLQILIDHAYFSQRICIVRGANDRLAKVNGNNYGNISLAMCLVINSLNHQNCLAECNCLMHRLLLNKC